MRIRGEWPNPISLRHGWARADARPWNRSRAEAHIRLVRGSGSFLRDATATVLSFGVPAVLSPPLMAGVQAPWRAAGFEPYTSLRLLRKTIGAEEAVARPVRLLGDRDWLRIVEIDAAAFGPDWKAELPALQEALTSARPSACLGIDNGTGELAGYAIVACSGTTGYLQRLAVHRNAQGDGVGRALTRHTHNWLRRRGARHIVLNTKPDNRAALGLYESEGYTLLPDRLELLRFTPVGT
ncbi:MAG: GNAT family N-acetyltransferase [Acidimicrobiia bacterium]|nr:GNAT family N-acetyltransferase [Acidimicrobiia bacterium]NNF11283.1 GNAT family N-acetyltransferase [Acidimicrobiia bacterium]NNL68370.1 GNAT family N-acetyltransferase [Acidimicrobiia bacterium]